MAPASCAIHAAVAQGRSPAQNWIPYQWAKPKFAATASVSPCAAQAAGEALGATVVNMRFIKPLDSALVLELAGNHSLLVTLEENAVIGGAGSEVERVLSEAGLATPVLRLGLPDQFIDHGEQGQLLAELGLDKDGIVRTVQAYADKI